MMSNTKKLSMTVFAMVTLLSCFSPVLSFALPRVTRTSDAIIIDYDGVGYSPFSIGRDYGQIANPGFIPVPSFNPYAMFYNGWGYSFGGHPNVLSAGGRQAAPQCGKGPAALPARSSITERVAASAAAAAAVTEAKKNAWPFLVVLKMSDAAEGIFFCSGSLLSDTKVLIAAQCLEKLSVFDISKVTVLIGATSKSEIPMTRRISKCVIHGKYNAVNYANDIAIITLDMPVVLSKTVGTVCLPAQSADPDHFADIDAAVMGWGVANGADGKIAVTAGLKQGRVSIAANADCKSVTDIGLFISEANTCVISDKVNTCPGDVGGPVVVNTAPVGTPAVWTQVAINSFVKGDCSIPGLKIRVSAFKTWIDQYMA